MVAPGQRGRDLLRRLALPAVLAVALAGCSSLLHESKKINLPEPPKQAEAVPGVQREHQRIEWQARNL